MVDFLVALAQGICICGLIYGAYLSITYPHSDYRKTRGRSDLPTAREPAVSTRPKSESAVPAEDRRHVRA